MKDPGADIVDFREDPEWHKLNQQLRSATDLGGAGFKPAMDNIYALHDLERRLTAMTPAQRRRRITESEALKAHVSAVVAAAPPLSAEQISTIRRILRPKNSVQPPTVAPSRRATNRCVVCERWSWDGHAAWCTESVGGDHAT